MTLAQWLKGIGSNAYSPIVTGPGVGIHDTSHIEHTRTYLWDLSDYYVSSVQAGVIWLLPIPPKLSK